MSKSYFFCGVGGSGMMPLAVLLQKSGHRVFGSDRSYDQGKTPEKFQSLQDAGIKLFAQDGSGLSNNIDVLVVSTAVEDHIPDVRAAKDHNIPIITRGALLAEYFNAAQNKIAIAGTSGKSTVTGMIATILAEANKDPTVVNGGEIINFRESQTDRFSSIRLGREDLFVAEMDESDGSIEHYNPSIAVLNNIALDHKTMEELEQLFGDYLTRASDAAIVNYDQPIVKKLCDTRALENIISYGIEADDADLVASEICPQLHGVNFTLEWGEKTHNVSLSVPGAHNVENALAALGVCLSMGLELEQAIVALQAFKGIHRRMEYVGEAKGIKVFDDFAHNPDKIAASLKSLKAFDGRLIVVFQMHGFGPLKLFRNELVHSFADHLDDKDIFIMPEVYYAGGTVDRAVTAKDIVNDLNDKDIKAHWFETREEIPDFLVYNAREGDRIVIMGARDDTLHVFAHDVLGLFS